MSRNVLRHQLRPKGLAMVLRCLTIVAPIPANSQLTFSHDQRCEAVGVGASIMRREGIRAYSDDPIRRLRPGRTAESFF